MEAGEGGRTRVRWGGGGEGREVREVEERRRRGCAKKNKKNCGWMQTSVCVFGKGWGRGVDRRTRPRR